MSNRSRAALLSLALSAALGAQTLVSPTHFKDWPGDLTTPYPFSYNTTTATTLRMQQIHQDVGSTLLMTSLSFRRAAVLGTTLPAPIPQKNMALKITVADSSVAVAAATTNWATNYGMPGTLVFSGTMSTPPSWTAPPRSAPAPFDLTIPFQNAALIQGTAPFLWDVDVTAASTNDRVTLDMASSAFALFAYCGYAMVGQGCLRSGVEMELRGTGQTVLAPVNSFSIKATTLNGPASASGVWLIGAQQLTAPLPGLCTNVYVNPLVSLGGTTDATGKWDAFFSVPYNPAYVGVPLAMQTAVTDATQPGLPLSASNGLVYRASPPEPAFTIGTVTGSTGTTTATSALTGRAVVVKFN